MFTQVTTQNMKNRLKKCEKYGVPITNYGMFISHCMGHLDRVMKVYDLGIW